MHLYSLLFYNKFRKDESRMKTKRVIAKAYLSDEPLAALILINE